MPKTSIAEKENYYPYIDGLRGIAILMVVLIHTTEYIILDKTAFHFKWVNDIVSSGPRGVQLFFMLSAFTLFSSSKRRFEKDAFPKLSFYIRRAVRILPFWWIMTLLFAIVSGATLFQALPSFLFYFGLVRFNPSLEVVPGGWSLFVEETFYILLPFVLFYSKDIKKAFKFFLVTFLLSLVWTKFATIVGLPTSNGFIQQFPFTQWFAFPLGIMLYFLIKENKIDVIQEKISKKQLIVLEALVIGLILFLLPLNYRLATLGLFLLFLFSASKNTFLGKVARNKILIIFGGYCYSIYLFHLLLLQFLDPSKIWLFNLLNIQNTPAEIKLLIYFPIVSALCMAIAFITFNLVEKPGVNFGKKIVQRLNNKTVEQKIILSES